MQLIDLGKDSQLIQFLHTKTKQNVKKLIARLFQQSISFTFQAEQKQYDTGQQLFNFKQIVNFSLYGKLLLSVSNYFIFIFSIFKNKEIKSYNNVQKTTIIRYFLATSFKYQNLKFIIFPSSGSLSIYYTIYSQNTLYTLTTDKIQQFQLFTQKLTKIIQFQIYNILYHLNLQIIQASPTNDKFTRDQLKQFILVSPHYAWKMLKIHTQSKKKSSKIKYEEARQKLLRNKGKQEINIFIESMKKVSSDQKQKIRKFIFPSKQQQQQFKNSYLSNHGVNKKGKLLNEIYLDKQLFLLFVETKQLRLDMHNVGKIHLKLQKLTKNIVIYQKSILQKFQNYEYSVLPKYYFIKNLQNQSQSFLITNLLFVISYKIYLQNNSQTISLLTKLHLLNQLALALRICRNHNIVYHKAIPQTLMIRKGLFLKLTDFSNSYHAQSKIQIPQIKQVPSQSFLPYVSNYQTIVNLLFADQKSDVYSLGNFIYHSLYGKTPFQMKYQCNFPKTNYWNNKLCQNQTIGIQKKNIFGNDFYDLLTFLSLECTKHQKIISQQQQEEKQLRESIKFINVKDRPYLDWIAVVIRSILENEKRKFL